MAGTNIEWAKHSITPEQHNILQISRIVRQEYAVNCEGCNDKISCADEENATDAAKYFYGEGWRHVDAGLIRIVCPKCMEKLEAERRA